MSIPLRAARRSARRLGWGLADQALSSLTNFAVGVVVARSVSGHDFGAFALAFSVYTVALGVSRALSTEAFVVRYSAAQPGRARPAARRATGTSLATGAACLAVFGVVGAVLGAGRGLAWSLGATMPGLLLQDGWRYVFFAAGEGRRAFANDAVWALLMVPAFLVAHVVAAHSAAAYLAAWGIAASGAALFGILQTRLTPNPLRTVAWLREHRTLWPRYLTESVAITATQQLYLFAVGAVGGLSVVGRLKLVQIALGPVNVVAQGVGVVAVPEAVRARRSGLRRLDVVAAAISLIIGASALCWGLLVYALPHRWTTHVVGTGWLVAAALVIPMTLAQTLNGANTGAFVGLRAFGAARQSMRVRCLASVTTVGGALVGVQLAGVQGAAYGLVVAAAVNLVVWWLAYVVQRGRHRDDPAIGDLRAETDGFAAWPADVPEADPAPAVSR